MPKPSMEKRSPIKSKPLRQAGQSLDEEIRRLEGEILYKYAIYIAGFFVLAITDWYRYLTKLTVTPWLSTTFAIVTFIYALYRIRIIKMQVELLELARDGERAVGEYIDKLRAQGYSIFHDIVGEGFNIDHVLLSPSAIFTIETKTRSKPKAGTSKVSYDGQKILVDGFEQDRDTLVQAKAQSQWLRKVLLESTGKNYEVRPVILFPGWYIESSHSAQSSGVWVLNPKALPTFIQNIPKHISDPDLHLAAFHISRLIRST
jgi:hypothetical protein